MLGELPKDLIGTDPKYLPIANLDWLSVDIGKYDNYPSDNNSVRIQPKLADLWGHNKDTGINLIPNQTVQSLKNAESTNVDSSVDEIAREAKKAMMFGLKGKELADHIRARFSANNIVMAKEAMEKLSEEQGLLGNVYIDASAFISAQDVEQFLNKHRNRLAQDIVINKSQLNPTVISFLASKFHKNVVANISYDKNLFEKYKTHLVGAGYIDKDFVIDSKETLRQAFLMEPMREKVTKTAKTIKRISKNEAVQEIVNRSERAAIQRKLASEEILFRNIRPILKFARQQLVKGKIGNDLKEILRGKYASDDLRDAAKYLALVISSQVTPEGIDKLVKSDRISEMIGDELKKLAKKYPLKPQVFGEQQKETKPVGVQGYFHALSGKSSSSSEYHKSALESLRKGASIDKVKDTLLEKLSNEEANKILSGVIKDFNEVPAGVKANAPVKIPKEKVVADLKEKQTLPDSDTIIPQTQEILGFFEGANFDIDVNEIPSDGGLLEINDLNSKSGIDTAI